MFQNVGKKLPFCTVHWQKGADPRERLDLTRIQRKLGGDNVVCLMHDRPDGVLMI